MELVVTIQMLYGLFLNILEGVPKNLRLVPGHFSPPSGPPSAMGYLELKLLRFQGLIWYINHFCILSSCRDIVKNAKVPIFGNFLFCKKIRENAAAQKNSSNGILDHSIWMVTAKNHVFYTSNQVF